MIQKWMKQFKIRVCALGSAVRICNVNAARHIAGSGMAPQKPLHRSHAAPRVHARSSLHAAQTAPPTSPISHIT